MGETEEFLLGIDDAGRGPVIGPMVLAGCLIKKEIEPELSELGVVDSKLLTRKQSLFIKIFTNKTIAMNN